MIKVGHEKKHAGPELTFNYFESNFKDVLNKNPILATRIDIFINNLSQKYHPVQVDLIRRAVVVGAVAHQNNEIEKKRFRKANNGDSEPTPYFIHPIEMAECMIPSSKDEPILDWITIAATLLHDVPEDVKLKGIEGKKAWLSTIEEVFKDTGYQFMLSSIIDGVTEQKLPSRDTNDETRKLYRRLEETPMYKMILSYTKYGGIRHTKSDQKQIYSEDRKNIAEVVYNLEHLFLSATQTPEELRIFFIKIADIWHNLQSPEWVKNIKVLRGRIAAGLAELLGWNLMRDKIIVSLAKITDVSTPFSPHTDKNSKTLFYEGLLKYLNEEEETDFEIAKQVLPQLLTNPKSLPISFREGFPIPHSDVNNSLFTLFDQEITTLPQPEIDVTIPSELFENLKRSDSRLAFYVQDSRSKKGRIAVSSKPRYGLANQTLNLLGRKQIELNIKPGNRNSFTFRIEDDQPHIIDMFALQGKTVLSSKIPELGLLNSDFTLNEDLLNTHIQALIGFCYEPSLVGLAGEGIVPIFHRASGRLYFLPKTLSVQEASEVCGIMELKASYSGQVLRDLYDSKYNSSRALQRIIEV